MKLLVSPRVSGAEAAAQALSETYEPCEIESVEPFGGWAAAAMAEARRQTPHGALALLTDEPLYVPGLDDVFGQAMPRWATACASLSRLHEDGRRAASVLVHETGHLWGLEHCSDRYCAMHAAESLADVDRRGTYLCQNCRPKRRPPAAAPALPPAPAFIYSPRYRQDFGPHPFPVMKYDALRERLPFDTLDPEWPDDATLALVHDREYLDDLDAQRVTDRTRFAEAPVGPGVIDPQRLMTGGTVQAARLAWESRGFCMNMGGGFHHAFAGMGHGFCFYNDVAVAIRKLQHDGAIRKAAVIDCDVHQGNGTARIFEGDDSVFTLSLHQENLFPPKQESTLDVGLPDRCDDATYLARMRRTIPSTLSFFEPDIVFYLAGADPYEHDRLATLALSKDGLRVRDEMVLEQCFSRGIPLCVVLAGGYAKEWQDTVDIHHHTCLAAEQLYGQRSPSASRNCS